MNSTAELFKKLSFFTEPEFKEEILEHGQLMSFNKGDIIVKEGQYVKFLPIVIEGSIRVFQQKVEREILLYYVKAAETCTMSLAAAYFNNKSTSHGVVMEAAEVIVFPASLLTEWQLKYPSWNKYVMEMFRLRYDELISSFERVAFDHVDVRLLNYLQKKKQADNSSKIKLSHQNLAHELGTTRVVISRILKQFERENKIKQSRGLIELI
ncbi:MAG: Crp/Fnr family transcriptional regulator [Flavisolibacter sp.]|nr:Crp/Fnr family transcriptional regulator [Flavisolibacter sp.]